MRVEQCRIGGALDCCKSSGCEPRAGSVWVQQRRNGVPCHPSYQEFATVYGAFLLRVPETEDQDRNPRVTKVERKRRKSNLSRVPLEARKRPRTFPFPPSTTRTRQDWEKPPPKTGKTPKKGLGCQIGIETTKLAQTELPQIYHLSGRKKKVATPTRRIASQRNATQRKGSKSGREFSPRTEFVW